MCNWNGKKPANIMKANSKSKLNRQGEILKGWPLTTEELCEHKRTKNGGRGRASNSVPQFVPYDLLTGASNL
eukprot:67309-Amphidinium_carterae.1